jgi:hypothetical protein
MLNHCIYNSSNTGVIGNGVNMDVDTPFLFVQHLNTKTV